MRSLALHVISSGKHSLSDVRTIVNEIDPYIDYFHIREKTRPARELWEWGSALASVLSNEKLIVNDRVDVALGLNTKGIHLAHHSLPPRQVRSMTSQKIGASAHQLPQAKTLETEGVDYLFFGHVFPSSSKPGQPPQGLGRLKAAVDHVHSPVYAIGGVNQHNLTDVLETGCSGIAVISEIMHSTDPGRSAERLRRILDRFESGNEKE